MASKVLTDKQQRFIDLYVIPDTDGSLNATKAYRKAYPGCKSDRAAEANSSRLLSNAIIRAEVDRRLAELAVKSRMTAEEAWAESRCIAKSDIGDIIDMTGQEPRLKPVNQIPESARRAIKSVKVKRYLEGGGENAREVEVMEFAFWDKPGQLNTRLKALGELKETVEHTGKDGGPIQNEHTVNFPDLSADEFRALSGEERMRRLRDALHAINGN